MTEIDIIILSFAKNEKLKQLTINAIESLFYSENPEKINFKVLVIESAKNIEPYAFPNVKTIYPNEDFNFNKFLNIGINNSINQYVCCCNNDLIFNESWATNLINAFKEDRDLVSASPLCPIFHPTIDYLPFTDKKIGYGVRREISGWCIMFKREILKITGPFDEQFKFWYADADYAKTLQKHQLKHALITDSLVEHLDGASTEELEYKEKLAMTSEQFWYFQYKWEHKNPLLYAYRKFRRNLRSFFR